jgi:RNA polymerase sigma-70 factor (ECF subfamily)
MAEHLALRLLGSDQDVDDVVQDAYVIALSRLDQLEEAQAFASYLAGVVVRLVRRLLRRRRLTRALGLSPPPEPLDPTAFAAADAPADIVAELRALYARIDRLPTDERIALLLRRVDRLPFDEVARVCGCSIATVKRRIVAAERRLAAADARARVGAGRIAVACDIPASGPEPLAEFARLAPGGALGDAAERGAR